MKKKVFTVETVIADFKSVHGDDYDYSLFTEYVNGHTKIPIICKKCGKTFWQQPFVHKAGSGCPYCCKPNRKLTTEEFIAKARLVHGDKYDYSVTEYTGNKNKVKIICPIHGVFEQIPDSHLRGLGCKKCGVLKRSKEKVLGKEEFIRRAVTVHGDRYGYSKVVYTSFKDKVCITCPVHGDFWQHVSAHLYGCGCPKCFHESSAREKTTTKEEFIKRAKEVHGEKYDYSYVEFKTLEDKVKIVCPIHGVFEQRASSHIKGCGCRKCTHSNGEERVCEFLIKNKINYIPQYKVPNIDFFCLNKNLYVDFYLPEHNTFIEYNGEQHYKEVEYWGGKEGYEKRKERDVSLRVYCKLYNIKLIEIPYTEYKNIEKILKKKLRTRRQ